MPKELIAKLRLPGGLILLVAVCFLIMAARDAQGQTVQPVRQSNASQSTAVTDALQADFGSSVEAVTAFRPFYLTGDFDGDGAQDVVVVVRIKQRRSTLPKDVRVIDPFQGGGPSGFPANPAAENKLALAVIHSWKASRPAGKFLLIGESPILILEYARATSSEPGDRKNLIELMSKRGKRRKREKLPPGSKGNVILLPTEVGGDSVLYWNGRTYRWEDSPDD